MYVPESTAAVAGGGVLLSEPAGTRGSAAGKVVGGMLAVRTPGADGIGDGNVDVAGGVDAVPGRIGVVVLGVDRPVARGGALAPVSVVAAGCCGGVLVGVRDTA